MDSLGHLCNLTNYLCFNTEVCKKRCFPSNSGVLSGSNTMLKSEEIAGSSFQHCVGGGGEVREKSLYSRLTCAQKRQECKFVPRLLSMIVDSRPSKLVSLWSVRKKV